MSVAAKVGTTIIRTLHTLLDTITLIAILLVLAFGCYAMWDSNQVQSSASAVNYEKYRPSSENGFDSFENLQSINRNVFAWLNIYGTNIDYPMVQGDDNIKYVNTSAEGKYSLSGAIFLDHRNSQDFMDFNSLVYGHHMDNNIMFGEITNFTTKSYFDSHRYGKIFFDGQWHGLEFFAFVHTDENDRQIFKPNITDSQAQQEYLSVLMEKAVSIREDVSVGIGDRIILLSTCSPNTTGGRDILVARLIDNVPENIFDVGQIDNSGNIPAIDGIKNFWMQSTLWVKIAISVSASLFITLGIILICEKIKRQGKTKKAKVAAQNEGQANPAN